MSQSDVFLFISFLYGLFLLAVVYLVYRQFTSKGRKK